MKQSITVSLFRDAFHNMNRGNNFSYEGLGALYEYLEQLGEDMELDVIALCCEFSEYSDLKEFQANYGSEDYPDIDTIAEHTIVIPFGVESFIVQDF